MELKADGGEAPPPRSWTCGRVLISYVKIARLVLCARICCCDRTTSSSDDTTYALAEDFSGSAPDLWTDEQSLLFEKSRERTASGRAELVIACAEGETAKQGFVSSRVVVLCSVEARYHCTVGASDVTTLRSPDCVDVAGAAQDH